MDGFDSCKSEVSRTMRRHENVTFFNPFNISHLPKGSPTPCEKPQVPNTNTIREVSGFHWPFLQMLM